MFSVAPQRGYLASSEQDNVVSVFHSINDASVITDNKTPELAKAFICVFQYGTNQFEVEVYFYLIERKESVRFTHSQGHVSRELLPEIESQSLEFVESLGFMMDSLRISGIPSKLKNAKLSVLPMFSSVSESLTPIPVTEAESDPFSVDSMDDAYVRPEELSFDSLNLNESFDDLFEKSDPSLSLDAVNFENPSSSPKEEKYAQEILAFLSLF